MSDAPVLRDHAAQEAAPDRKAPGAVTAVLTAMAMVVIDSAMLSIALPTIAHAFGITAAESVQVVSTYQMAVVMFLLPCAAVGEALGLRKVSATGLITFAIASIIAASAPAFSLLIAARFVQGIGAATIMALGVALLRQALPEARLATAIGWNAITVAVCSAAGPMVSAALLTVANWPSLFIVHLPLGALALATSRHSPSTAGTGSNIDLISICFSATGFGALLIGLGALAAPTFTAAITIVGGVVCFWAVSLRSRDQPTPVIPLDLLRQRTFRLSFVASICCFIAQTAGLLAVSYFLQDVLELTPLITGIYMTPWPVAVACAALMAGRVLHRRPNAALAPVGAATLAAGLAGAAAAAFMADPLLLGAFSALCGIGFGLFQVANNRVLFLSARTERSAAAGGLQGTARLTGQAIGAVVVALLFRLVPLASAPRLALIIGSILAVVSSLVSSKRSSVKNPSPIIC